MFRFDTLDQKKVSEFYLKGATADGSKFLIGFIHKKKQWMHCAGMTTPQYDGVVWGVLHPVSGRFACIGAKKDAFSAYVDDSIYQWFSYIDDSVTMSPDGSRFLITGLLRGKAFDKEMAILGGPFGEKAAVILDGNISKYDAITGQSPPVPYFSPNGNRCAYSVRKGKDRYIVIDGVEQAHYDATGVGPNFSQNGATVAYAGYRDDTAYAVINGREYGPWTSIDEIALAQDGSRFAFIAARNFEKFLQVDTAILGPFDEVWNPQFDPRVTLSYLVKEDTLVYPIIGSQKLPGYRDVGPPVFSPDGSRYAYQAFLTLDTIHARQLVVVDGIAEAEFSYIYRGTLKFSPDNRHCAYVAEREDGKVVMVLDGVAGKPYMWVGEPFFSPDGSHLAYQALFGPNDRCVVQDGVEGKRFPRVGYPYFSITGSHLAYFVGDPDNYQLVIDDVVFEKCSRIFPLLPVWQDDNTITFIAQMGNDSIYRIIVAAE